MYSHVQDRHVDFNDASLLSIRAVAKLLGGCSVRHIRRLSDSGRMPRPVKLGHLIRWRRADLEAWITAGCTAKQTGGSQ